MASEQPQSTVEVAESTGNNRQLSEAFSSNSPTPLSKNAQKKAVKAARFAAQKLERRAKEKEAKKQKKKIRAQKRAAGELEEDEIHEEEEKRRMMKRAKSGAGQKPFEARVCVDLGFDDMMTDKVGRYTLHLVADLCVVIFCRRKLYRCAPSLGMFIAQTDARLVHFLRSYSPQ